MVVYLSLDDRGNPMLMQKVPEAVALAPSAAEQARRRDAVREAAREFEDLSVQDLRERLRGATTRDLDAGDLERFRDDVRAQVLDDLLDALDQRHRGALRSRRRVRLTMPRGYERKLVASLSASETADLRARLRARGWAEVDVLMVGAPSRAKA